MKIGKTLALLCLTVWFILCGVNWSHFHDTEKNFWQVGIWINLIAGGMICLFLFLFITFTCWNTEPKDFIKTFQTAWKKFWN